MRELPQEIALACLLACFTPACNRAPSPPSSSQPSQPPSESPPVVITGRERLGWDQQAPDADDLGQYSFVLYVDGSPVVLLNATCGVLAGEGPNAPCSSPLPALLPGQHTLELGTRITRGGTVLESARSALLVVMVSGAAAVGLTSVRPQTTERRAPDDAPYLIETAARGLDEPTALARTPDGRLLIAERLGRVRIAEAGLLLDTPAVELADADAGSDEGWSLALAPDFGASRHVYVSYIARDTGGSRVGRVVRLREVGGILAERAVIFDDLPAQSGALRTRIGPDGALYVGTTALNQSAGHR